MNMPGLTAGASLYNASGRYRIPARSTATRAARVMPQLPIGFCMANCDNDDYVCKFRCLEQGDPGGPHSPPQEQCRPGCGPCLRDSESTTGRSKTCIRRNCDHYTLRC